MKMEFSWPLSFIKVRSCKMDKRSAGAVLSIDTRVLWGHPACWLFAWRQLPWRHRLNPYVVYKLARFIIGKIMEGRRCEQAG